MRVKWEHVHKGKQKLERGENMSRREENSLDRSKGEGRRDRELKYVRNKET